MYSGRPARPRSGPSLADAQTLPGKLTESQESITALQIFIYSLSLMKIGQICNFENEPLAIHHPPCHSQETGCTFPEIELTTMMGKISLPSGPPLMGAMRGGDIIRWVITPRSTTTKVMTRSVQPPRRGSPYYVAESLPCRGAMSKRSSAQASWEPTSSEALFQPERDP